MKYHANNNNLIINSNIIRIQYFKPYIAQTMAKAVWRNCPVKINKYAGQFYTPIPRTIFKEGHSNIKGYNNIKSYNLLCGIVCYVV